jgi:NADH-quinone oxidoreductase subunit N
VVKVMYFDEPQGAAPPIDAGLEMRVALSANGLAILGLGILPGPLLALCLAAIRAVYPLAR